MDKLQEIVEEITSRHEPRAYLGDVPVFVCPDIPKGVIYCLKLEDELKKDLEKVFALPNQEIESPKNES